MPCYHPLRAVSLGKKSNGKSDICFIQYVDPAGHSWLDGKMVPDDQVLMIPCGQCIGCRIQYSRQWANRCMMELQYHDSAYFVTLTYDDAHVPTSWYTDPDTGEAFESMTLCKRDLQLFMKRLRKRFSSDHIRFFACGEYGSQTYRPHYHLIIFGLHLPDLTLYKRSTQDFAYYNSEKLSSCWRDSSGVQIGHVVVADVSWETCAYVARYVTKKLKGKDAVFYQCHNITSPFTQMSRKPGIARQYYEDHPGLYDTDYIHLSTEKGGLKFRPPRYFDMLYDLDDHEHMERIKVIRRRMAQEAQKAQLDRSSLSLDEILSVKELNFTEKIKSLKRSEI